MANLKRWSQDEITKMRSEMDKLFDDLCADFDLPVMFCRMTGDLDLREEGETLVARMELGNISPDDVNVSVFDRRLLITAKTVEVAAGHRKTHSFKKEIKLPCLIETKDVHAEFDDGVLIVRLPKCSRQGGTSVRIIKR